MSQRLCALALAATAVIHAAVVPEHAREWPAAAVFFVILTVAELALAVTVMRRPSKRLLVFGAGVSAASGVLWLVSRTVGLPFGPEAFAAEPVAMLDTMSTALEVAAALLFVQLATRAVSAPSLSPINSRRPL